MSNGSTYETERPTLFAMRALIYTRASLDLTGEGRSNSRQRDECIRLAEYKRWDIVQVDGSPSVDDVSISAYGDKERPGWERVLEMIEAGLVDVVVAYHLDRLTRNMADLERLIVLCEEHGVSVATATGDIDLTNDTGRMVARILAAVARQEVERKAARQKLAHIQRRAEGRPWKATKILGYDREGNIIEEEAKAIRDAVDEVLTGKFNLADIGRRWSAAGLHSPKQAIKDDEGNITGYAVWTQGGVKRLLTNPRIAGYVIATKREKGKPRSYEVIGRGEWEPIIDDNTFTLATARLNDVARVAGERHRLGRKPANMLSGLMTCSRCGAVARAGTRRGVQVYACRSWHAFTPRTEADELVRSAFASALALNRPGAVLPTGQPMVDPEGVLTEIKALRERQELLARTFARGITPADAYEAATSEIAEQITELESKLSGVQDEVEWERLRAESVKDFLSQDWTEQRKVLERSAVVTVHPAAGKPMSARWQVEVQVRVKRGGEETLIPAHVPGVLETSA